MRRLSPYMARRSELEIKMTPMIDVVFLLLIFFIATASFQMVEYVLPSNLAEVVGAAPADTQEPPPPEDDFDKVIVRVQWHNGKPTWRINDLPVSSLEQVHRRLETIVGIQRDAPIILHPDPEVPLGAAIDVYDITRLVGFEKTQFAASGEL